MRKNSKKKRDKEVKGGKRRIKMEEGENMQNK